MGATREEPMPQFADLLPRLTVSDALARLSAQAIWANQTAHFGLGLAGWLPLGPLALLPWALFQTWQTVGATSRGQPPRKEIRDVIEDTTAFGAGLWLGAALDRAGLSWVWQTALDSLIAAGPPTVLALAILTLVAVSRAWRETRFPGAAA
jgi:hypothetical protein